MKNYEILNKRDIIKALDEERKRRNMKTADFLEFIGLNPNTYYRYRRYDDGGSRKIPLEVVIQAFDKLGYNVNLIERAEKYECRR